MALKFIIDTLDDVPEALRDEYLEKDGKFHLNVDGLEDTSGLKSALEKERKSNRELQAEIKRWRSLGKTDEEIQQLIADHEKVEREKAEAEGDFQRLLKQHQDQWEKEKADLERQLNAARTSERAAIIETRIMTALTKAGATEEGVDLLPDRLVSRIRFETDRDGKRVISIMQADGETPMTGTGPDGLATFDDLIKEASDRWPSLFQGSGQSGSGKKPGEGAQRTARTISRADFEALSQAERRAKLKDGFKLVD